MLQITRRPVKVFRSTDDQAPQLTNSAGSLKTLLEACLVAGYGEKSSLDWEMPFSDARNAAFKSKAPDSTGCYLQITNENSKYAYLKGFKTLQAINRGELSFEISRFPYLKYNSNNAPWLLVGHEKAFWLFIHHSYYNYASNWFFFGDFPSFVSADTGNCLIAHDSYNNSTNYLSARTSAPSSNTAYIQVCKGADQIANDQRLTINSRCLNTQGVAFPDPITGGLQADEIDLHESGSHRGYLPGLYACSHTLNNLSEGEEISSFDNSEDRFAKLNLYDDSDSTSYYLINLTAWIDT